MCRFMLEVSELLHIFLSLPSFERPLAGPALALRWPRAGLRGPRWKPWLVLCGNFKGPSIRRPWKCLFIPILHAGLGWGPEPELGSALCNATAGLASPGDVHHIQKRSRGGRRRTDWEERLNESFCMWEETTGERLEDEVRQNWSWR